MLESQIFRANGVGSRSWYTNRIKIGFPAGKTGFTYLRADSGEDGKQLSFDEIKSSMSQLVAAGYVKKHGKPDAPRSDKYEVTSFGHRYLEEHKDELEIKPDPKVTGAVPTGVEHHVPKIPTFKPSIPTPVSESPKSDTPEPSSIASDTPSIDDEPMTPVFQDTPVRPITPDPENHDSKSDEPTTPKNANSDNLDFVSQLKLAAGEILVARHAAMVTVKDLLEHLEKK
jgi:hypothetical protein